MPFSSVHRRSREDPLTYARAEQAAAGKPVNDAKLFYYETSYASMLGSTFAHRFSNNVGRIIVDGVLDAADYYDLGCHTIMYDTDRAVERFFVFAMQLDLKVLRIVTAIARHISGPKQQYLGSHVLVADQIPEPR